jgi:hypothetical protein
VVHGCCSLSVYIQGTSDDRTHGPYEQLGVGAISIFGLVTSLSRATFEVADKKEKEREKVLTNIFGAVPFLSILFLPITLRQSSVMPTIGKRILMSIRAAANASSLMLYLPGLNRSPRLLSLLHSSSI